MSRFPRAGAAFACAGVSLVLVLSPVRAETCGLSVQVPTMESFSRPGADGLGRIWPALLLMGVLDVAALTAVTLAGGLPKAEYAAVASSVFGIVTILLAWRFLNEPMRAAQWGGVALVFAGIAALGLA